VDKENLRSLLNQYADHGIGAVEITPVDGIEGNDENNIPFLSDRWLEMLRLVQEVGKERSIEVGMATGTGWPFGGPWVPLEESCNKALFVDTAFVGQRVEGLDVRVGEKDRSSSRLSKVMAYCGDKVVDVTDDVADGCLTWKAPAGTATDARWHIIALYVRYGIMKVKRSALGGAGWVIDHFDSTAVANYLAHFEEAFERTGTPYPHTFFNDSYEVFQATWTTHLLEEFEARRGYKLQDHLPELTNHQNDKTRQYMPREQVMSDYRETLSDLLLENFTRQWTAWAHRHGAITRNQAHGSPSNLIDCYAAVDIPEIEGFGYSNIPIKGLRRDEGMTLQNYSDYSMFKYAPSAAHICGKTFTSSETFTWLTEHFRTSLSQMKPDLDLMFCAGVNHIFFHGTTYSPQGDPWPGWKFYATVDMSPTNTIWRDAPYLMQYITRCQSFLQMGCPDNDFLVLLPVRDMWKTHLNNMLMMFSIHDMHQLAPAFIKIIQALDRDGFDCDYISERLLMGVSFHDGMLTTAAGTKYRGLIIPGSGQMPEEVRQHIEQLRAQGAPVFYTTDASQLAQAARPEALKTELGLKAIRRRNATGYHYFMANLTPEDISGSVSLAVPFRHAVWFNPLNGEIHPACYANGKVEIALRSGESMILQTWDEGEAPIDAHPAPSVLVAKAQTPRVITLTGPWTLSFIEEAPHVERTFQLDRLQTWENLEDDSVSVTMGTGVYTTQIKLSGRELKSEKLWRIDLGDVRESARVFINGQYIGCAWSVPFVLDCKDALKPGKNEIRIEVTNLPANRVRDLDLRGVKWRKMTGMNLVDIHYHSTTYEGWKLVPSGLNSEVRLIN